MVGRSYGSYERALRGILSGDPAGVRAYSRSLPPPARAGFERLIREPFLVVRAAGSFGFDLVALRREFAFPIEVKASSSTTIPFTAASGRAAAQLADHRATVERAGLLVLYAYRRLGGRDGESWRVFRAGEPPHRGVSGYVLRPVPPIGETREGNAVLRWEEGMLLSAFVARVYEVLQPSYGGGG